MIVQPYDYALMPSLISSAIAGGIVILGTGVPYKFGHDRQFDFESNFGVTKRPTASTRSSV